MIEKQLHVLVIPSWYPRVENPLSGIFFREQSLALKRAGYQVGLIYPQLSSISKLGKSVKWLSGGISGVDDDGVMSYRLYGWRRGMRFIYGPDTYLYCAIDKLFNYYVKRHGMPNIIHAHSALMGGYQAAFLKQKYGIPFVVTEHSSAIAKANITLLEKQVVRDVCSNADEVIVVSPQLGELLNRSYDNAAQDYKWVPNMVEEHRFVKNVSLERTPRADGKIVFLNVSMLIQGKGHIELLKAFSAAFSRRKDVTLRIGGNGNMREELEKLSKFLGISAQVKFLGLQSRNQVFQEMRDADVFVFPSHFETFGVVLIEALASGIPIIATKSNGPECICMPENGLLVSVGNVEELSEGMQYMALNYQNYNKQCLIEKCWEQFGERAFVSNLTHIYQNILRDESFNSDMKKLDSVSN